MRQQCLVALGLENNISRKVRVWITIGVVIALMIVGGIYGYRSMKPRPVAMIGTIVSVDRASRSGKFRFVHPKTGETLELAGTLAPDCALRRGSETITIADLQPGDRVDAKGMYYLWGGKVVATSLTVLPPEGATSRPASASNPAGVDAASRPAGSSRP